MEAHVHSLPALLLGSEWTGAAAAAAEAAESKASPSSMRARLLLG